MGALSHLAGERCDWRLVAVARTLLAFVLSAGLAASTGVRPVVFRPAVLWVRSLAGSASLLCAFYAMTHLPVSTAFTLTSTVPVWVTLLAWPALGQLAMTKAFATGAPSRVSVVGLAQIVFALFFDLALWHRQFDALTVAGIALVAAPSGWLILHNPLRRAAPTVRTTA